MIRFLRFSDAGFAENFREISERGESTPPGVLETVQEILNDVRKRGDAALFEYTERFDRLKLDAANLEVSADEIAQALAAVDSKTLATLQLAADRIAAFHAKQKEETWLSDDEPDIRLGQMVTPLDRVGIYVPGGKAAYPSSVLMNAVPAKVAGVGEIIMVVPMPDGVVNPYVLAAAHVAGVDRIFKLGGAQAVAALAYGTETIPKVDKITGPGNSFVATAKRMVFGVVGIDMIAGPSEILVVCDGKTNPDWIAMDLFSQAEHDEEAQSILICPDKNFINLVKKSMDKLIDQMTRKKIIKTSLEARGLFILVKDLAE